MKRILYLFTIILTLTIISCDLDTTTVDTELTTGPVSTETTTNVVTESTTTEVITETTTETVTITEETTTVVTTSYIAPELSYTIDNIGYEGFRLIIEVINPSSLDYDGDLILCLNGETQETIETLYRYIYFDDLTPGKTYTLEADYTYYIPNSLDTGFMSFTEEIQLPEIPFSEVMLTEKLVSYNMLQVSVESETQTTVDVLSATIYKNSEELYSIDNPKETLSFDSLESETKYRIVVLVEVDSNNGYGTWQSEYYIYVTTDERPTINTTNLIITSTTVTFDVEVNDDGNGVVLEVSLLDSETEEVIATITDLTVLTNLSFTGLDPDTDYIIYVRYENDTTATVQVREAWLKRYITTLSE